MTDLYQTGRNSKLFYDILPEKGNLAIGKLRAEKVILHRDGYVHLKGPPIAVYHPEDYDTAEYRALISAPSTYATNQYGLVAIWDITISNWLQTTIRWIDPTRTTIVLTGAESSEGDELIVYYYADGPVSGGGMNNLQGDILLPDDIDILTKVLNDALPTIFGQYGVAGDGSPEFMWSATAASNLGVSATADTFVTLFDSAGTGSSEWDDFPVYISEITVKIPRPHTWGDYYDFRITVDGTALTHGFDDSADFTRWIHFDPSDYPTGSDYDAHPGKMYDGSNNSLFTDVYTDIMDGTTKSPGTTHDVFRFGLYPTEAVTSIKVEMRSEGYTMSNVGCYIRGIYTLG